MERDAHNPRFRREQIRALSATPSNLQPAACRAPSRSGMMRRMRRVLIIFVTWLLIIGHLGATLSLQGSWLPAWTAISPNSPQFSTQTAKNEVVGLYYLRARLMNPLTGRFWSADSYEGSQNDPQSLHKYLYANSDPVNHCDPSGRLSLAETLISAAISGTINAITTYALEGWKPRDIAQAFVIGAVAGAIGKVFGAFIAGPIADIIGRNSALILPLIRVALNGTLAAVASIVDQYLTNGTVDGRIVAYSAVIAVAITLLPELFPPDFSMAKNPEAAEEALSQTVSYLCALAGIATDEVVALAKKVFSNPGDVAIYVPIYQTR